MLIPLERLEAKAQVGYLPEKLPLQNIATEVRQVVPPPISPHRPARV
jgi:hypothetical protein